MNEECANCAYFLPDATNLLMGLACGLCRKHAPQPAYFELLNMDIEDNPQLRTKMAAITWPVVFPDSWCGEYSPKPED